MKIVHVPRRFVASHWGGTETVVLQTCRELKAAGHDVRIVTSAALSRPGTEDMQGIAVERHGYFYPWLGLDEGARRLLDQKGGNLFSFSLWRALLREPGLDVLHLHTAKRLGGIVRHAARRRGIPYVISVHGGLLDMPAAEQQSFVEPTAGRPEWGKLLGAAVGSRRVFDDAAAILCLGSEEARRMREQYPRVPVHQFPNGVDAARFATGDGAAFRARHGIAAEAPLALVMGRIDPQKNQLLAVEALESLRARVPGARLLLVGHVTNDAYHAKVREAIAARGLAEAVTLIPGVAADSSDLVDAFHAADVFLLPSVHEPFGIVILEAWAAWRAVVASRVGGVPSFVEDGRDGLLFESGDAPGAVAHLAEVLGNPARRAALAEAGRRKAVAEYAWPRIAERLLAIYEEARRAHPLR